MATIVTCRDCDDLLTELGEWHTLIGLCRACWIACGMPPPPRPRHREVGFARRIIPVTKVSDER